MALDYEEGFIENTLDKKGMKSMLKKVKKMSWLLVVTAAALMVASCAPNQNTVKPDEKMTITWMGAPYYPASEEGSVPELILEKKFNIEIKPIFMDGEAYKNKKPVMMSSGEIPDLIYELDP